MKKPLTEAQKAGYRKKCRNGVCPMTREERNAQKRAYVDAVLADPFRHEQYLAYFRKRRAKPGMRERVNEQNRRAYNKDIEKSRAYCREKYQKLKADPVRYAAFQKRKREQSRRRRALGIGTRREQILYKLVPRWERVIAAGRDEAYIRRTTATNAALFRMWRDYRARFDEMMKPTCRRTGAR